MRFFMVRRTQPSAYEGGAMPLRGRALVLRTEPRRSRVSALPGRRQLRRLAADRDTTLQALLGEAVNDLFAKHGLPELVERD